MLAQLLQILEPKGQTLTNSIGGGVTLEAPSADQFRQMLDQLREAMAAAKQAGGDVSQSFALRNVMQNIQNVQAAGEQSLLSPDAARQLALLFQQAGAADGGQSAESRQQGVQALLDIPLQAQAKVGSSAETANAHAQGLPLQLRDVLNQLSADIVAASEAVEGSSTSQPGQLSLKSGLFDAQGQLTEQAPAQLEQLHVMGKVPALMQELSVPEQQMVAQYFASRNINITQPDSVLEDMPLMQSVIAGVGVPVDAEMDGDAVEMLRGLHAMLSEVLGDAEDDGGVKNTAAVMETLMGAAASDALDVMPAALQQKIVMQQPAERNIQQPLSANQPAIHPDLVNNSVIAENSQSKLSPTLAASSASVAAKPVALQPTGMAEAPLTQALPLATTQSPTNPIQMAMPNVTARPEMPSGYQPPADQIIVSMRQALTSGDEHIRIKLSPVELGRVDVQMQIDRDGMTQLRFVVENADTLDMLQRDSRALIKMLDDIGIKTDSKQMQFNLQQQSQQHAGQQQGEGRSSEQQQQGDMSDELQELLEREPISTGTRHHLYQLQLNNNLDIQV